MDFGSSFTEFPRAGSYRGRRADGNRLAHRDIVRRKFLALPSSTRNIIEALSHPPSPREWWTAIWVNLYTSALRFAAPAASRCRRSDGFDSTIFLTMPNTSPRPLPGLPGAGGRDKSTSLCNSLPWRSRRRRLCSRCGNPEQSPARFSGPAARRLLQQLAQIAEETRMASASARFLVFKRSSTSIAVAEQALRNRPAPRAVLDLPPGFFARDEHRSERWQDGFFRHADAHH